MFENRPWTEGMRSTCGQKGTWAMGTGLVNMAGACSGLHSDTNCWWWCLQVWVLVGAWGSPEASNSIGTSPSIDRAAPGVSSPQLGPQNQVGGESLSHIALNAPCVIGLHSSIPPEESSASTQPRCGKQSRHSAASQSSSVSFAHLRPFLRDRG